MKKIFLTVEKFAKIIIPNIKYNNPKVKKTTMTFFEDITGYHPEICCCVKELSV
jgi:hypothetical protein